MKSKKTKYYHATPIDNIETIRNEGLRPGFDGSVHLTTNLEKAHAFMYSRFGVENYVVFNVKVSDEEVKPFYDGTMSGDDCYVHRGSIDSAKVKTVGFFAVRSEFLPSRQS